MDYTRNESLDLFFLRVLFRRRADHSIRACGNLSWGCSGTIEWVCLHQIWRQSFFTTSDWCPALDCNNKVKRSNPNPVKLVYNCSLSGTLASELTSIHVNKNDEEAANHKILRRERNRYAEQFGLNVHFTWSFITL